MTAIVNLQRGIPSERESSARVDYALCTHRPSLRPIEWSGEMIGSRQARDPCLRGPIRHTKSS
eukprot:3281239-Pyramimonas_sp.AAC.1